MFTAYIRRVQICLDAATLRRITQNIRAAYPSVWLFEARWALIATWYHVTFYGATAIRRPVSNTSTSTYCSVTRSKSMNGTVQL